MSKKTTINDIASTVGVAPSTVCKALNGMKGVTDSNRLRIQQVAEEFGYIGRRGKNRCSDKIVAVLFPDPSVSGFEFYGMIWNGIRSRSSELSGVGLSIIEFMFNGIIEDQLSMLKKILESKDLTIDCLVTLIWDENPFLEVLDEYTKKGIPVFTITSDAPSSSRISSIRSNPYQTGRLAAEYLGSTIPNHGSVIITGTKRNAFSHGKVVRGFIDQMALTNPDIQVIELYENKNGSKDLCQVLMKMIESVPDIRGIYANNARMTSLIGQLLLHNPKRNELKIVGSEVSEDSVFYLNNGVINALIDEQPFNQGYHGMSLLYDYLCKGIHLKQTYYVSLNMVLQNNVSFKTLYTINPLR